MGRRVGRERFEMSEYRPKIIAYCCYW